MHPFVNGSRIFKLNKLWRIAKCHKKENYMATAVFGIANKIEEEVTMKAALNTV